MKKCFHLFCCAWVLVVTTKVEAGVWDWIIGQLGKAPVDYGLWSCPNCYIPGPNVPVDPTGGGLGNIHEFIKYNNPEIHDSKGEKVHRWIPNSSITVCNANNLCLTVYYPADTNLWVPRVGSYPVPPGKTPKVPKNPDVSKSPPPSGGGAGRVGLVPIGLPATTSQWSLTLPETTRRVVTPSVTIKQDGVSTTYIGSPVDLGALNDPTGDTLEWKGEAAGLNYPPPGCLRDCNRPQ
jgi:hypothetical protein